MTSESDSDIIGEEAEKEYHEEIVKKPAPKRQKLTMSERLRLIDQYRQGRTDKFYSVAPLKNKPGEFRITKRKKPLDIPIPDSEPLPEKIVEETPAIDMTPAKPEPKPEKPDKNKEFYNKCAENEEIKEENKPVENIPENNEEKKEDEEEKLTIKKGHVLSSTIGNFIIDKTGIVYYENFEEFEISGIKIKLTEEVLSTLGKKEKYVNNTYQNATDCVIEASGCTVEGYKLDLENISSAYETYNGNGEISTSIIFISYDGQVSELIFKEKDEKQTIEITKNNPEYKDIVSVVPNMSFGGNSTILIDKYGNKHEYK